MTIRKCEISWALSNASYSNMVKHKCRATRVFFLICVAIFGVLFTPVAHCQTNLTSIAGTIADATGAAVPNCQVEATNLETSATRTIAANGRGDYLFSLLPVGNYEISASAPGFGKSVARINVTLTGATLNLTLSIAQTSSEVKIDASASQVALETESHDLTSTFSSTQLTTLPNNSRNILNTATLGPAVQAANDTAGNQGDAATYNQTSSTVYIAGLDNYHTSYLQDGVENVDLFDQVANIVASAEATQEVSTILNNAPARFGAPAVINVITKGGTNHFHGTAYDFLQNNALNARNWFAKSVPLSRYNLFGANLGGPVIKNKLFFFFDYSGLRNSSATVFTGRVPTLAERSGDFSGEPTIYDPSTYNPVTGTSSAFLNNQIPTQRFDTFAKLWLTNYPVPNTPLTSSNVNYIKNLPTSTVYNNYLARGDWNISPSHTLLVTFAENNQVTTTTTITPDLFGINFTPHGLNVAVSETATIGANTVNVVKFGYNRGFANKTQQNAGAKNYAQYYGLQGLDALPSQWAPPKVTITGLPTLGDPYSPQEATQNRFQYADEINRRTGNHSVSIGGQFVQTMWDGNWALNNNGSYSVTGNATADYIGGAIQTIGIGFADLLLGLPTNATAAVGVTAAPFRQNSFAVYIQDDWKPNSKVTINLGLRYDFAQAPWDKSGHSGIFSVAQNKVNPGTFKSNLGDWGPRIGFSWSMLKDTVLRGGYGIYYGGNVWGNLLYLLAYPPNLNQVSYTFSTASQRTFENAVTQSGSGSALPNPWTMDNPFKDPTVHEYNLNVQHSLGTSTLLTVGYLGNTSRHVESRADLNQAYALSPGNTTGILDVKPNPNISAAYAQVARATANFNGLIVTADRRFVNGLQFLSSYTWSKSMDLLDGDNGALESIYHPRISYAPAGWDRTHNFLLSGLYALPIGPGKKFLSAANLLNKEVVGGWNLSGVYHLASGEPISITAVNNADRSAYVTIFARQTCNPNQGFQRTRFLVYNAACFAQPANGQYGIGGRSAMRNPRLDNVDLALVKVFPIYEGHELQFRAEMFDVLNHPNFLAAGGVAGTKGLGNVTSSTTQRVVQFALRYSF
jgi:hypothetical protein